MKILDFTTTGKSGDDGVEERKRIQSNINIDIRRCGETTCV